MIIPIRCMNCGMVLADKWLYYKEEVKRLRSADGNDFAWIYLLIDVIIGLISFLSFHIYNNSFNKL